MAPIKNTAKQFFDACETGKGWAGCKQYCHPAATFSAQRARGWRRTTSTPCSSTVTGFAT